MNIIPNKLHYEIIPGILEQNWSEIEKKIELVKPFAKTIHIDIIDGIFAQNRTYLDPENFKKYSKDIIFELHIMTDNPVSYIKPWANAGFQRFIGQIELMPNIEEFVAEGQFFGEVGLALDTPTNVEKLNISLDDLDFVFVMTVKAGFSRQTFLPEMLEKVKKLRSISQFIPIEVDGGINDKTLPLAKNSGATRFVSTGFIFRSENLNSQYEQLNSLLNDSESV